MTEHKIDLKGADEPKWLFDRSGAASRVTSSVLKIALTLLQQEFFW